MSDLVFGFYDCTAGAPTFRKVNKGDEIYIKNDGKSPKIGDQYEDYHAIVTKLDYTPKKWYQFWRSRKLIGYVVTWL